MPHFGKRSLEQLSSCHPDWHEILNNAIKRIDFSIIRGHRGKSLQDEFFKRGTTKVEYPNSYHNTYPSLAVDCIPYPFKAEWWESNEGLKKFEEMANIIIEESDKLDIDILWGPKEWGWDNPHFHLLTKNNISYEKIYLENDE